MDGVNVQDVGTLAGLSGIGGYYGGRSGNFHGDGSAVNANVVANRDINLSEAINAGNSARALSDQIATASSVGVATQDRSDRALSNQMSNQHDTLSRQIADNRLEDRFNSLVATITSNDKSMLAIVTANDKSSIQRDFDISKQMADCCCELRAGQSTIIANQESHRLATAEAENQQLRLQVMINNQGSQRGGNSGGGGGGD